MTDIIRHKSAGEKGRLYSRRARDAAPSEETAPENTPTPTATSAPAPAETTVIAGPHPGLLEHLGPAYLATPDGDLLWHNDTFMYFARTVWELPDRTRTLHRTPPALQLIVDTLIETGHFEPRRIFTESGGVERVFRGRHFLSQKDGSPVVYGYFEDITQQISGERRLTALDDKLTDVIRSTSDWVWETDTELRLTEVSARIAAITGAPPRKRIWVKPCCHWGHSRSQCLACRT